jgi:hypothetical protein
MKLYQLKFNRASNLTGGENITRKYYFDDGEVIFKENTATIEFDSLGFDRISAGFRDSVINNGEIWINGKYFGEFKFIVLSQTSEKVGFSIRKIDT